MNEREESMYYSTTFASPVGNITLACGGEGRSLVGLWLERQKYYGSVIQETMIQKADTPIFHEAKNWLERYFAGEKPDIAQLSLAPIGSAFRQEIWKLLCEIPYGEVVTYGDIARKMAAKTGRKSMSGQAVGGAVSHNPISIIIPCHRVVGSNGSLTGYAGGIETKIRLLELEGVDMSRLFVPQKGTAL